MIGGSSNRDLSSVGQVDIRTLALEDDPVETLASFRLFGASGLSARAITERLSVSPSNSYEAGDPISTRSDSVRDSSAWLLRSSEQTESGVELEIQLERLLAILEPLAGELHDLVADGYEANWFCYVASEPTEHAVELPRQLLRRLIALPGDLWLDVCGT